MLNNKILLELKLENQHIYLATMYRPQQTDISIFLEELEQKCLKYDVNLTP